MSSTQTPLPCFLEARAITRRFGGITAVDDVSLTLFEGEIFGLIGPNGAGKTTLFNIFSGLVPPSAGEFCYLGKAISGLPAWRIARQGIARTFQNIRLFDDLSVLQNVEIGRHRHLHAPLLAGLLGLKKARADALAVREKGMYFLEVLGLADKANLLAKDLSYGDKRRVEIARALALEPRLLLLDEPTAGMNRSEKNKMAALVHRLRSDFGLTVFIIEHHVPLMMDLCDRIAVLNFGRLIALDVPEVVRCHPAVIEAYLGLESDA